MSHQLGTASQAFNHITSGQKDPWIAIGDFLDDFYRAATPAERLALVTDPPIDTSDTITSDPESLRWAALLAGAVEWLCHTYAVPTPDWIHRPEYALAEPWFLYAGEKLRPWLLESTPPEFVRRNVFCGDRALDRV